MWIAKFRIFDEKSKISMSVRKNQIKVYYYPINHYIENKRFYFIAVGLLEGNEISKKQFIRDLRKLKKEKFGRRLELLEIEGDFFITITSHTMNRETKLFVSVFYNPHIIHFQPVIFHEEGWEEWSIASIKRKDIEKLIQIGEKKYKFELLQLTKKKIKNLGFLTILPELTIKQKEAIELAMKHGYYEHPRKIGLEKLAKLSKVSYPTFQEHLRKAERKLLPFVIKRL